MFVLTPTLIRVDPQSTCYAAKQGSQLSCFYIVKRPGYRFMFDFESTSIQLINWGSTCSCYSHCLLCLYLEQRLESHVCIMATVSSNANSQLMLKIIPETNRTVPVYEDVHLGTVN